MEETWMLKAQKLLMQANGNHRHEVLEIHGGLTAGCSTVEACAKDAFSPHLFALCSARVGSRASCSQEWSDAAYQGKSTCSCIVTSFCSMTWVSYRSATLHAVGALGFINLGTTLAISGLDGPAAGALGLAAVFGVMMFQGFRRIDRLDKFEKDLKG
eukprot:768532-Pelagomonas_calceolata.AAC.1